MNGVAAIHSEILKHDLFKNFYELWPEKFQNKTNGITPRRWLVSCNPALGDFICEKIGPVEHWIRNLELLQPMKQLANDQAVLRTLMHIKLENKRRFAHHIKEHYGIEVNPEAMFDIQVGQ